ncbi:MAG: hypothetical protein PHP89_01405 [Candidatus Omnitrophica bacterium]|jgi:hypothetical protein|nr:hypothetical protein [Candidatus Omnitrophota bacterium]MDD3988132.1 hypothetical protein [Candidatus Omnitrophota bacterium]MDD4981760.1 hypothetical protein [Candidatus Omnitrophota bacterium]MDD5665039.1 hypothetical protein [Candidatus Omnitrophota bacterium]
MVKEKITILSRVKHMFLHHPWLKLISLALAIISWMYIKYEMIVR